MKYPQKTNTKKYLLALLAILLIAGSVYAYFALDNADDSARQDEPESIVADPEFNEGTEREPMATPQRNGTISEDGESDDEEIDYSLEPIVSDSGEISVMTPQPDDRLAAGDKLAGTANVNQVHYRLIDNHIGVIASGSLSVKDGKFSGTFDFESQGSQGRLDIFSYNEDGVEENQVEINVRFN
jgi:hypothetical protein